MSEGITRIIRITNSRRLADRFLSVQIKEPDEPEFESLGKIFALVEIESPLKENRQLGQTIINTLSRNYFKEGVKDVSEQFEAAVKQVNKELYKIAKSGDSDWLGKINAVLGLAVDGDIHLSSTGKVYAWVVRNQVENHILDDEEQVLSAQKTFSHIVSGTLESKDTVIIASSGLLELISQSTLKGNVFGSDELLTAAIRFAQILRAKKGYWINGILIDFHSFQDATELSRNKIPETIYLDSGSNFDLRILTSDTLKATSKGSKRVSSLLKSWGTSLKTFTEGTALPANKKAISTLKSLWMSGEKKIKSGVAQAQQKIKETQKESQEKPKQIAENNLIGKNLFAVTNNAPKEKKAGKPINLGLLKGFDPSKVLTNLGKKQFWKEKNFYLKLFLGVLLVVLILNLGTIISGHEKNQDNEQLTQRLEQLQEKYEEASLALTLNQKDIARDAINSITTAAPELLETEFRAQAEEIIKKTEILSDELDGILRLELTNPIMELAGGKKLVITGSSVLAASSEEIVIFDLNTKKELRGGFTSDLVDTASQEENFLIYSNNNINSISKSLAISRKTTSGAWPEDGKAIESFVANLYILSPQENQIFKYAPSGSNFGAKTNYIKDQTKIPNAVDMAIDGKIYVLNSDGTVLAFSQGTGSTLNLGGNKLTAAKSIRTTEDQDNLYILANNRINVFTKNGTYVKAMSTGTIIEDFVVSEDENKIFILSEGKVFELNLEL